MVLEQQVVQEMQVTEQPVVAPVVEEDLESLEKSIFRADIEASLMETQTRLEETYRELNRVGLEQYRGVLGQILGYLADFGVIDGSKRLKRKRKNIVKALARINSQTKKSQRQLVNGNKEYAKCLQTFYDADRVMRGYEAKTEGLRALLDEKRQELANAQQTSDPKDRSYLQLPIEIGKIETDIITSEYKMGRAASKVVSCDRRLDTIDHKRKVAMQQIGVLGNMTSTLEAILDVADSSFGEGINPLDTLKAVNYAARTVNEVKGYVEVVNDRRSEINDAMNELPKLLEDQFDFSNYGLGEVVTIETDRTIAAAKKAVEKRLHGSI